MDLKQMRSESRDRGSSRGRVMTAWLAREVGKISVARTAKYFQRSGGTMIIGVNRLEGLLLSDPPLCRVLSRLSARYSLNANNSTS